MSVYWTAPLAARIKAQVLTLWEFLSHNGENVTIKHTTERRSQALGCLQRLKRSLWNNIRRFLPSKPHFLPSVSRHSQNGSKNSRLL